MKKKKINLEKQDFDLKKAESYKDFSKIAEGVEGSAAQSAGGGGGNMTWILGVVAVVVVVVSLSWLFSSKKKKDAFEPIAKTEQIEPLPVVAYEAPFPKYDIPYEIYDLSADKASELLSNRGSIIRIPENAFMDKNGQDIQDEIELWYREFHSPFEMFAAGIPMTTETERGREQLESAGMFEILAFQKGKPLSLKEGKIIDVELVSFKKDPTYNNYTFDEESNQWDYVDRSRLSDRDYVNPTTYRPETDDVYHEKERDGNAAFEQSTRVASKSEIEPYLFEVEIDGEITPELADFESMTFEVDPSISHFDPKYYHVRWSEVSVKPSGKEGKYIVSLHKSDTTIELLAEPVIQIETSIRSAFEEKEKNKKVKNDERLSGRNKSIFIRPARMNQSNDMIDNIIERSVTSPSYYSFPVITMGLHNVDIPIIASYPNSTTLELTDQYGIQIEPEKLYVADIGKNTVINLGKTRVLRYNNKMKGLFWFTTKDGNLGFSSEDFFNRRKSGLTKTEVTVYPRDEGMRLLKTKIG